MAVCRSQTHMAIPDTHKYYYISLLAKLRIVLVVFAPPDWQISSMCFPVKSSLNNLCNYLRIRKTKGQPIAYTKNKWTFSNWITKIMINLTYSSGMLSALAKRTLWNLDSINSDIKTVTAWIVGQSHNWQAITFPLTQPQFIRSNGKNWHQGRIAKSQRSINNRCLASPRLTRNSHAPQDWCCHCQISSKIHI